MPVIKVLIYTGNSNYPKDLAHILTDDIKPTYKMFPIDMGTGEQIEITLERKPKPKP